MLAVRLLYIADNDLAVFFFLFRLSLYDNRKFEPRRSVSLQERESMAGSPGRRLATPKLRLTAKNLRYFCRPSRSNRRKSSSKGDETITKRQDGFRQDAPINREGDTDAVRQAGELHRRVAQEPHHAAGRRARR